jgi:hypothetical protein
MPYYLGQYAEEKFPWLESVPFLEDQPKDTHGCSGLSFAEQFHFV